MQTKEKMLTKFFGIGAVVLIAAAGCTGGDQTGDGQTADSPAGAKMQNGVDTMQEGAKDAAGGAVNAVENSAESVGNAASNAANAVGNAAVKAGDATVNAANKAMSGAKNLDDAALMTPKIKTALGANAMLKGSNINVDTTDKNVTLSGTVKSAAQKNMAGNVAKQAAPGYAIKNNLMVGGAMNKM